jgi:hypothetical protein
MKYISTMGMLFLPGTFLAVSFYGPSLNEVLTRKTLFSMGFFNWIPDRSNNVVSPWIAVYGGLTLILTGGTIWRWRKWNADQAKNSEERISKALDGDVDSINSFV